jgi:hypothetical protein
MCSSARALDPRGFFELRSAVRAALRCGRTLAALGVTFGGCASALAAPYPDAISASDLDGRLGFAIDAPNAFYFGDVVSTIGDVNGDGIDDFIVTNNQYTDNSSYVVFGQEALGASGHLDLAMLDGSNGFVVRGAAFEASGAGDVNGDGYGDLLVADTSRSSGAGATFVIFGGPSVGASGAISVEDLDGSNGLAITGVHANDHSGNSVDGVGDINGDGFDDILIGASSADPGGQNKAGESYLVFGAADLGASGSLSLGTLDGRDGFVMRGQAPYDYLGFAVSSTGDLNGDGLADFVIGATQRVPHNPVPPWTPGEAFVVFGASNIGSGGTLDLSALDGSTGFVFTTDEVLDQTSVSFEIGRSLGSPGDVNGDHFDDLLIAGDDNDDGYSGQNIGAVSIVFGGTNVGASGRMLREELNGHIGFVARGRYPMTGTLVASDGGDVNGDGSPDITVAAIHGTFILFGGVGVGERGIINFTLLDGEDGFVLTADADEGRVSTATSRGDFNGDGLADVLMGVPQQGGGRAYVLFGGAPDFDDDGVFDGDDNCTRTANPDQRDTDGDGYGNRCDGDLNNDGFTNFLDLGAMKAVFFTSDPNADLNGDGTVNFEDLGILRELFFAPPGPSETLPAALPVVFDLWDLNKQNGLVLDGAGAGGDLGVVVSTAGDLNGDGFDDVVVGDYGLNGHGAFYVVFGASSGYPRRLSVGSLNGSDGFVISPAPGASIGDTASALGDFNGDGLADLIVSDSAAVIFGRADIGATGELDLGKLNGHDGFRFVGVDGNTLNVTRAGDVNGDGNVDVLLGAPYASPGGRDSAGQTYVVFGGPGVGNHGVFDLRTLNGSNGFVASGIDRGDGSGSSVAGVGDVNGDGIDDFLIGAFDAGQVGDDRAGEAYLVFGSQNLGAGGSLELSTLDGSNGCTLPGTRHQYAGWATSGAGDFNGDGRADFIVGAPGDDDGTAYVMFGHGGEWPALLPLASVDGNNGFLVTGVDPFTGGGAGGRNLGGSAASAGDLNGDGFDDIVLGAAYERPDGVTPAGAAYVLMGGPGPFTTSFDLTTLDGQNGFVLQGVNSHDFAGQSVSGAGDVNGDGLLDLLIGAPDAALDTNAAGQAYVVFGQIGGARQSQDVSSHGLTRVRAGSATIRP